jgi:hypothetical protein
MAISETTASVSLSGAVYSDVLEFLESQGLTRPEDLSGFVEDALQARIFDLASAQARTANTERSEAEIEQAIDEALAWARRP